MLQDEFQSLLAELPLFAGVDDAQIGWLAERSELVRLPMGRVLFNQGDAGDSAYVVYTGKLRIILTADVPKPVTLAVRGRGEIVGEAAILTNAPRNASVRAAEESALVKIERQTLLELCTRNSDLADYFARLTAERGLMTILRQSWLLQPLSAKQVRAVMSAFETVAYEEGAVLARAGDEADRLILVSDGEVQVARDADRSPITTLGSGELYGERQVVAGEAYAETLTAVRRTECLLLAKSGFDEIIADSPAVRDQLLANSADRATEIVSARPAPDEGDLGRAKLAYGLAEESVAKPAPRRRWQSYPFVRQLDETDCGAACLSMISRYHGKRISIARLRDLANVGHEGASMYSLAQAAETIGFKSRAVRTNYSMLPSIGLPAICHWAGYHYVVLYAVSDHDVVIGDPAIGVSRIDRSEFESKWPGLLLLLDVTPDLLEQPEEVTQWGRFAALLRPHKRLLGEIFLASFLLNLFGLASPIFVQTIVDNVIVHDDISLLNIMLFGMLALGLFQIMTSVLRQYLLVHVSTRVSLDMSVRLFRRLLRLPMRYFHTRKIGDIIQRFDDNEQVTDFMTSHAFEAVLDVIMVFVYFTLMFIYSVKAGLLVLFFVPFFVVTTLVFAPRLRRFTRQALEKEGALSSHLIETIGAADTIKANTAELPNVWKHENLVVDHANSLFKSMKIGLVMDGAAGAIDVIARTVVLWYTATLVLNGELSIGQFVAFHALFGMVMPPLMALVGMWDEVQHFSLSLQRLSDIHDAEPEQPATGLIQMPRLSGQITFDNVTFRYSADGKNIIANNSLTINPGETVALVGRSGSGKTTWISLLQGLYFPVEGRILIDGMDITKVDLRTLRAQMGVVLQENQIFTGTIRDNIAVVNPEVSLEQIVSAAKAAAAHDFINALPFGYETMIGDVGIELSGGQRQRLCIARAFMRDPSILVFDEGTSALDSESERAIQKNMQEILGQRTAIVIAHRLSTIRNADRIIVLDDGVVIEQGRHPELMARKGLYYYLHTQQAGG